MDRILFLTAGEVRAYGAPAEADYILTPFADAAFREE